MVKVLLMIGVARSLFAGRGIICCLVGARTVGKLDDNLRAAALPLPARVVGKLNDLTAPVLDTLGSSFDYFEGLGDGRTR